jgi:hypothetical protein
MNKEKADEIINLYGKPRIKIGKNVLVFARQNNKDILDIEKMTTKELKQKWKNLVWSNVIYGQTSLNDMQRINLIELEFESRNIKGNDLRKWFDKTKVKFEKEQNKVI